MLTFAYDLRGIFKKDLDWGIIYSAVQNFLKDTKTKNILLASDFNPNNLKIKHFLKEFYKNEIKIDDLGVLPTPLFYYQVIKRKTPGIIITASHLPLKYSGLKFILPDGQSWKIKFQNNIDREKIGRIAKKIEKINRFKTEIRRELYREYFQKLKQIVRPKRKIFVEFDLNNFFLKISYIYFKGLNIFHKTNSLIKIKADFDNDRIFVFYKNKRIIPDLIFYSLALEKKYRKLGVPIFFSQKLKNLLKNKKFYFIFTGHNNFKFAYRKYNLDLAFEPSGHFYLFKDLRTEGPYLALALFLHKTDLNQSLPQIKLQINRFDLKLPSSLNLEKVAFFFKRKFGLKLKRFDGYWLWKENFYLHFRKSKTENKLRVTFEGNRKYLGEIKKWLKKL